MADPEQAIAQFREHEQAHRKQLAEHEELLARLTREWGAALEQGDSPLFGSALVLHYAIDHERTYVAWCQWVMAQLEQLSAADAL
ncbi:MAG: hypothetical protein ABI396_18360 [Ktedonobacteraceae bacterium]